MRERSVQGPTNLEALMTGWAWMSLAIVAEIVATSSLKASAGFSKLIPSVVVVLGYGLSFWWFSIALKLGVPVGISYAVWSAVGTVGVILVGRFVYGESVSMLQYAGVAVVLAGVAMINIGGAVA
jgi:small multidrug resistance pump